VSPEPLKWDPDQDEAEVEEQRRQVRIAFLLGVLMIVPALLVNQVFRSEYIDVQSLFFLVILGSGPLHLFTVSLGELLALEVRKMRSPLT
jgi:hypothetical protein